MSSRKTNLAMRASAVALASATAIVLPTAAMAQSTSAAASAPVDEGQESRIDIVVTAARRTSTALSTPLNLSAIDGDELAKNGVQNFQDLSRSVSGLVFNGASLRDGGASSLIIHGINVDSVNSGGERPAATIAPVSVYVGETPAFVNLHLADVSRVEVLRGPQATLYGNASIAGTLRVLFNEPEFDRFAANIATDLSWTENASGPNYNVDLAINQPLAPNLALRVAGGYSYNHGFIDAPALYVLDGLGKPALADPTDPVRSLPLRTSKDNINENELGYIRTMLRFEEGPLRLLATYHYQHEYSGSPNHDSHPGAPGPSRFSSTNGPASTPLFQNDNFDNVFPTEFDEYETGAFILQPLERDVHLGSLEASYDLGFATLTSVTSAYETDSVATNDSTAGYQNRLNAYYNGYPRTLWESIREFNERAIIQELRLVSQADTPLTYSLGAFYMHQKSHLTSTDYAQGWTDYMNALPLPNMGTDTGYIYDRQMTFDDMAAFGELTYHLTDAWQITGGMRVFNQKLEITASNALPTCGPSCSQDLTDPLGIATVSQTQEQTKVLFKANTSYQFPNRMMAYLTFSQGVRRGGASGIPTTGPFGEDPAYQFYNPDSVDNYEIGLKGRIGRQFEFSSALYWVEWHDPQVNVSTPNGGFPATVNGDTARSRGVDLEGHYTVGNGLTLHATYSYNDSKLTAPIMLGTRNLGGDGTRLPGTPRHIASGSIDYEQPVGATMMLDARAHVSYRSGTPTNLTPASNVDLSGFAMFGASIGLSTDAWRLSLFGENLGNERGVLSSIGLGNTDVRGVNNRLSQPRTIGARFSIKY